MGRNQSMEAEAFVIGGTEILTVIAAVVTLATVIASTIIAYKKDNERLSNTKETLSKEHTALQQLIQERNHLSAIIMNDKVINA